MSRAFVKEDADDPPPRFSLPDPGSPYFDEAAAWALIEGANMGDSQSAELATGCSWGEPRLLRHVAEILERAESEDNLRIAQLARRFLRAIDRAES
jgi:hypothetical protein